MKAQEFIRQVLYKYLEKQKLLYPKYSLRLMAKEAGISAAALSSFLKGKRNFSRKMGVKVFTNLNCSAQDIIVMEEFFVDRNEDILESHQAILQKSQLQSDLYYLVSDPVYYSYLCLLETVDFIEDDLLNSKQLNISKTKLKEVKNKLLELKLIQMSSSGELMPTRNILTTTDNTPNYSLRSRHIKNMEDSKHALSSMSVDKRYFVFETLSFDEEDLPLVQAKINQLTDDLLWLSKKGSNKKHVYEFCSQYFPRSFEIKD